MDWRHPWSLSAGCDGESHVASSAPAITCEEVTPLGFDHTWPVLSEGFRGVYPGEDLGHKKVLISSVLTRPPP